MKIRCSLCGKKYVLTHNGDQCPECGQRNYREDAPRGVVEGPISQIALGGDLEERIVERFRSDTIHENAHAQVHSDLHEKYDGSGHHVDTPKSFSPHYNVNATNTSYTKLQVKKGTKGKPRTCVYYFITIILLQIVAVLFGVIKTVDKKYEEEKEKFHVDQIQTIEHENEGGYYSIPLCDYEFIFADTEDLFGEEIMDWNISDEYEMSVYYYDYFWEEDNYYGFHDEGALTEIYAVTKDGRYIAPIASYEAEELVIGDPYGSIDYVSSDLGYQYGYLCFLVKKDDIDYIVIDEYSGEEDDRMFEIRHELK